MKELDRFDPNPKKNVSLKAKLIAMIVGASIIGVAVSGAAALITFHQGLLEQTEEDLEHTTSGVEWILQDWLSSLDGYVGMLASTDHIKGYLDKSYTDDPTVYLNEKAEICGLDMLALTDKSGRVIAGYEAPIGYTSSNQIVRSALLGKTGYSYDEFGDIEYGLLYAAPVIKNGNILGSLIAGYDLSSMDEEDYIGIIHKHYIVDCTIFDGKVRVATTLGDDMIGTELDNEAIVQQVLYEGKRYVGRNIINGIEYFTVYTPLSCSDGTIAGLVFVAKAMSVVESIKNKTLAISIPISTVLFLILATIGYHFVRWIMKRLNNVTVFLGELASGDADLTKRCALYVRDEIGTMIINFDLFMDKLHEIVKTLKESKADLGTSGENLEAGTEDTSSSITEIIANINSIHTQSQIRIRVLMEQVNL